MQSNITQLMSLMDKGYEDKCYELKVIQRKRKISKPADLMQLSLIHLVDGCSLVEVSEFSRLNEISPISDVGFMKRFAECGRWFEWITSQLATKHLTSYKKPVYLTAYNPVAVDASDVVEKGRSGRTYRLHYAIELFSLRSYAYKITTEKVGESLKNFMLKPGDLVLGDRIYGTITGIKHCLNCGADFLLRLRTNCFNIYDEDGNKIEVISQLRDLDYEESTEFTGYIGRTKGEKIPLRICAKRKSEASCKKARKEMTQKESKRQMTYSEEARQLSEYIVIATSLPSTIACDDILETYRYRWQIENYFKRLKTIMDFGDLPKKNEDASLTWLKGKLMVALLMEILINGSFISPYSLFEERA